MEIELDHVFVCTAVGAPEAERLVELGLTEGTPNTHPGQGTANRRFFFDNAFLELVWVADEREAQSELVRPTGLWERWSGRAELACPFGIGLRPTANSTGDLPFPTWEYRPPYLPDPLVIHMGEDSRIVAEPLLFYLAFGRRPDRYPDPANKQLRQHAAGMREITRVAVQCVGIDQVSPTLGGLAAACSWLDIEPARAPLMEVTFDNHAHGKRADLRPALPLVLLW